MKLWKAFVQIVLFCAGATVIELDRRASWATLSKCSAWFLRANEHSDYKVRLFSRDPLLIYIQSFVDHAEAKSLIDSVQDTFQRSLVARPDGKAKYLNTTARDSKTAFAPPHHATVKRVTERAVAFHGYPSSMGVEPLVIQRYAQGGYYEHHHDYFRTIDRTKGNRGSSMMVYLDGSCTGGGTNFPNLERPSSPEWCDVIDCSANASAGVTFKAITGNAVFWYNLNQDGTGNPKTLHSGLPVEEGTKIGLNIWFWETFTEASNGVD